MPRIAASGNPAPGATLKSARELEIMREAGRFVAFAVRKTFEALEQGITTGELDSIARRTIESGRCNPRIPGTVRLPGNGVHIDK